MLISERIYKYMEEKGISQIEFSKKTGISQSTISDWRRKGTKSNEYALVEMYQNLNIDARKRLEGYMKALSDMK